MLAVVTGPTSDGATDEAAIDVDEIAAAIPDRLLVEVVGAATGVVDVTHDSRDVEPGSLFACVVGEFLDGHDFAAAAVEQGAIALIVERRLALDVAQIVVSNAREAMGHAAAAVHGRPATRLRVVGVTGTNGKTTTTHLIGAILSGVGMEVRQLGTLSGARTTPEATDLQRQLAEWHAEGVEAVVMEVSSHALALHRTAGARFDVAVFTNLGRDHLDLHESMEAYFRAKASLFDATLSERGVVNADDPYGRLILDTMTIPAVSFGDDDVSDVEIEVNRIAFTWRGRPVVVPVGGEFNLSNTVAALTAAVELGVDIDGAITALAGAPGVPGRFELVSDPVRDGLSVVVDYAHTPDGIVAVLAAARAAAPAARIVVVFGCGGDRDQEKRPLMGAAAAEHADVVVITSDNPRGEDPERIVEETYAGVGAGYRDRVLIEVDRRTAIATAIGAARPGDVVVIAGKGHESTQTIGDRVVPFDDRTVAREVLAESLERDGTGEPS